MSHGHDHGEYQQQAVKMGGTPNGSKGLIVLCDGEAHKSGTSMKPQTRIFCLTKYYGDEVCGSCENSRFTITLQTQNADQEVACPRWHSLEDRLEHKKPHYVHIRREFCLTKAPFDYCASCVNRRVDEQPENRDGWWEERAKQFGTVYR